MDPLPGDVSYASAPSPISYFVVAVPFIRNPGRRWPRPILTGSAVSLLGIFHLKGPQQSGLVLIVLSLRLQEPEEEELGKLTTLALDVGGLGEEGSWMMSTLWSLGP